MNPPSTLKSLQAVWHATALSDSPLTYSTQMHLNCGAIDLSDNDDPKRLVFADLGVRNLAKKQYDLALLAARGRMNDALTIVKADELGGLLTSVASGNRAAFDELYQVTSRRLFPIVRRIVIQRDLAEDVLQETYLTIWRKAGQYDPKRGPSFSWMAAIARNRAIDRLRRDNSRSREDIALDDSDVSVETLIADETKGISGEFATIRQCVDGLQKNHRKAILFGYYYGMTHEEMASHFDAPLGTVKSWVRRGLHQLKECCEQ